MRFSLRTLLLLFPALIVAFGLARCCERYVSDEPEEKLDKPVWHKYAKLLQEAQYNSQRCQVSYGDFSTATVELVNDWLTGKISQLPSKFSPLGFDQIGRLDLWGRPLQCKLFEYDNPCAPGYKVQFLQFYSFGLDGISNSHGNDPDDLSSWDRLAGCYYDDLYGNDDTQYDFYDRDRFKRPQSYNWGATLWYLPWSCGVVFLCCLFLKNLFSNPLAAQRSSPNVDAESAVWD